MIKRLRDWTIELALILRDALVELLKNDPLRLAGATAFFTTFALPPIIIILIQATRLFIDPRIARKELLNSLSEIFGPEAVKQISDVLYALRQLADNWWIAVSGFIFLIFVATTLFKVIKNSLNQVWKIRWVAKKGIVITLRARAQAVAVILVAAMLFVVGIFITGVQAFIGNKIFAFSPLLSTYFTTFLNTLVSIVMVTAWFASVFRYLPDGRPQWSVAFSGAFLTAIFFTIGKLILHFLLSYSNLNTLYGASASIVQLLLFMFYSALILYYGAAFTKIWGLRKGKPIMPLPHAIHYKVIEAEIDDETIDYTKDEEH